MRKNKKGVSEILSYVLLIGIAVAMSVGIFAWLKTAANITPAVDCEEETSLFIENYECKDGKITISLKNNGRFNIDWIILTVSDVPDRAPIYSLISKNDGELDGYFSFSPQLNPGKNQEAEFNMQYNQGTSPKTLDKIEIVQIQPFIRHETAGNVVCKNAVIKQNLKDCPPPAPSSESPENPPVG